MGDDRTEGKDDLLHSLSRPTDTLGHEIRNQLHAALLGIALITKDQTHIREQGARIERSVHGVSERLDHLDARVTEFEKQTSVRVSLLEQKIGPLEKVVYGLCAAVLVTVLGGVLALVMRANGS